MQTVKKTKSKIEINRFQQTLRRKLALPLYNDFKIKEVAFLFYVPVPNKLHWYYMPDEYFPAIKRLHGWFNYYSNEDLHMWLNSVKIKCSLYSVQEYRRKGKIDSCVIGKPLLERYAMYDSILAEIGSGSEREDIIPAL